MIVKSIKSTLCRISYALATTLILICSSSAIDGRRGGAALGIGGGFSPYTDLPKNDVGYYVVIDAGYAFSQHSLLTLEANALFAADDSTTVSRNFRGIAWYYYFGDQGKTFYSTIGIASMKYSGEADLGFMVGGGYEFMSHLQLGAYFIFGRTANDVFEKNHAAIQFALTGFLY